MPPRGVAKGTKRARQYEHIKQGELKSGLSEGRAEEIAARTVNKERARLGETKASSRFSRTDRSSGLRSGTERAKGRTYKQLYDQARALGIAGRSAMRKGELGSAVERTKG